MAGWRRPGGYGPASGLMGRELMHEQQEAIGRAEQETERRIEAEKAGPQSLWKRLRNWFKP